MLLALGITGLYLVARITGMAGQTVMVQTLLMAFLLGIVAVVLWLKKTGQWKAADLELLILILGMAVRIGYTLATGCEVRSHDLEEFSLESGGHAGYLLTLLTTGQLPDSSAGQYYQQPLFYLLGSVVSASVNGILNCEEAYWLVDAAKLVSCFASCAVLLIVSRFTFFCGLKDEGRRVTLLLVSFLPAFWLSGGRVAPDALTAFFLVLELCYTFYWWRDPSWKHTLLLAVIYGCGLMTKISCGVLAPVTALLFLIRLVQSWKEKRVWKYAGKYAIFAGISLPLGLWYGIRNFLRFGQPLTYVASPDRKWYRGGYSLAQRLVIPNLSNLPQTPYADPRTDYNAPVYYLKTALFGEFGYAVPAWIPSFLLLTAVLLSGIAVYALYWKLCRDRKDRKGLVLALTSLVFYGTMLYFYQKYPYGCSMDFRYYLFLAVPMALLLGSCYEKRMKRDCRWWVSLCLYAYAGLSLFLFLLNGWYFPF